jgi:hypothetical protein
MLARWLPPICFAVASAAAHGEPTLLGLVENLEPGTRGRFTLEMPQVTLRASGRWWALASGGFVTDFDLDAAHVEAQLEPLRQRVLAADPAASLSRPYFRGTRYQLDLLGLLEHVGLLGPTEFVRFAVRSEGSDEVPAAVLRACDLALQAALADAAAHIAELKPAFRAEGVADWQFPVTEFDAQLAARLDAVARACGDEVRDSDWIAGSTLRLTRKERDDERRLSVWFDDGSTSEPNARQVLELRVTRDDSLPEPPERGDAPSFFDLVALFRLKVHECRALPWEYSAHDFTPPQDFNYLGPGPFLGTLHCERSVLGGVKTAGAVQDARAHVGELLSELREVASVLPRDARLDLIDLLANVREREPEPCVRQSTLFGPPVGPVRIEWSAERRVLVDREALTPAGGALVFTGGYAHASYPAKLVAQFEAVQGALEAAGFERRPDEERRSWMLASHLRRQNPIAGAPLEWASLDLDAQIYSDGKMYVRESFSLRSSCLEQAASDAPHAGGAEP